MIKQLYHISLPKELNIFTKFFNYKHYAPDGADLFHLKPAPIGAKCF